jgi:hypothetical protein
VHAGRCVPGAPAHPARGGTVQWNAFLMPEATAVRWRIGRTYSGILFFILKKL